MRKFEVGKRYNDGAFVFEIVKRTAKTIRFVQIQHAGRSNERRYNEGSAKIEAWDGREVFFKGDYTVEA